MFRALHKFPGNIAHAQKYLAQDNPTLDSTTWLLDFVDHIVNQETWKDYFSTKYGRRAFKAISNGKALQEEIGRMKNRETTGKMALDFIPTRGLLLELSGHMADACWADKYRSIAEQHPNICSVSMIQNRGTKNERVAGSCILIETKAANGDDLLLIRGLNPIQNVINQLDTADFYEKFVAYIKNIAKAAGRKTAIVIDGISGGSATNRPGLATHLNVLRNDLARVSLLDPSNAIFNGYNVYAACYLIE